MISYQLNNKQSKLFKKNRSEFTGFLFVLALSCVLMIADARYHRIAPLRQFLLYFTVPLQVVSEAPARIVDWSKTFWQSKHELVYENQRLAIKQLMLQEELQHLQNLRQENDRLKALLELSEVTGQKSQAARVISFDTGSSKQTVVINKGKHDHVFIGQPVLDQHGVMGQVIEVGPTTSNVLLISDSMSAVPVKNNRTGERGILAGTNRKNRLVLLHLPKSSTVAVSDLLITSGLGGRYPEGYPVGRVVEVINTPGDDFIQVNVTPLALLNRSQLILLIWPNESYSMLTKQWDKLQDMRRIT